MHTIDVLEECLAAARHLNYQVRQEWLGGVGGGACVFGGKHWIFLDLGLNTAEQLEQAASALRQDPRIAELDLSATLKRVLALDADHAPVARGKAA